MRNPICLIIGILLSTTFVFSQKKPLDHSVYDGWKSLQSTAISNDGNVVATLIAPQEGDTALLIQRLENKRATTVTPNATFDRVTRYTLSRDGQWVVGLLKAPLAERRQARIDKKKKEEAPKDSLLIVDNRSFAVHKIPDITSYRTAREMGHHVAYSLTLPKDTAQKESKEKKAVILRDLVSQHEDTLYNVKEHVFNRWGNAFAVIIQPDDKDSIDVRRVEFFDLVNNTRKTISSDQKEYRSLVFDEPGGQLTYLATGDTSKVEQKEYDLRYYSVESDSARVLADRSALGLPEGWIFNEYASPSFSKNGERILIGAALKQPPKDTTIVDFEMAKLDIWHWMVR